MNPFLPECATGTPRSRTVPPRCSVSWVTYVIGYYRVRLMCVGAKKPCFVFII